MPRVPPFDRPATYEDLERLPDNFVAEIVDGELHASPRPAPRHASAGSVVGAGLGRPFTRAAAVRAAGGSCTSRNFTSAGTCSCPTGPAGAGGACRTCRRPPTSRSLPTGCARSCRRPRRRSTECKKLADLRAREASVTSWLIDPLARTLEVLRLESGPLDDSRDARRRRASCAPSRSPTSNSNCQRSGPTDPRRQPARLRRRRRASRPWRSPRRSSRPRQSVTPGAS